MSDLKTVESVQESVQGGVRLYAPHESPLPSALNSQQRFTANVKHFEVWRDLRGIPNYFCEARDPWGSTYGVKVEYHTACGFPSISEPADRVKIRMELYTTATQDGDTLTLVPSNGSYYFTVSDPAVALYNMELNTIAGGGYALGDPSSKFTFSSTSLSFAGDTSYDPYSVSLSDRISVKPQADYEKAAILALDPVASNDGLYIFEAYFQPWGMDMSGEISTIGDDRNANLSWMEGAYSSVFYYSPTGQYVGMSGWMLWNGGPTASLIMRMWRSFVTATNAHQTCMLVRIKSNTSDSFLRMASGLTFEGMPSYRLRATLEGGLLCPKDTQTEIPWPSVDCLDGDSYGLRYLPSPVGDYAITDDVIYAVPGNVKASSFLQQWIAINWGMTIDCSSLMSGQIDLYSHATTPIIPP